MIRDRYIKETTKKILENKDLDLIGILEIATSHPELNVREMREVLKLLNFWGHDYLNNTTDWFESLKPLIDIKEPKLFWVYASLGITFEDIENSKGYVVNNTKSEERKAAMAYIEERHPIKDIDIDTMMLTYLISPWGIYSK